MNGSSNLLVLDVTGQVGKRVATNLKRGKANFSVGSRREANLEEGGIALSGVRPNNVRTKHSSSELARRGSKTVERVPTKAK